MIVGVTGADGFLGKYVTAAIRRKGYRVITWDHNQGDLADFKNAAKFVKGLGAIVHAAGVNRAPDMELVAGNIIPVYNLARAVSALRRKPKLIFTSSIHATGETVYGLSKRLSEIILEDAAARYGIPLTIFRFSNIFGPGARPQYNSAVASFAWNATHGKPLRVNDPQRRVSLLYVEDVAKIIVREAGIRNKKPALKTIAPKRREITVRKLAETIQRLAQGARPRTRLETELARTVRSYVDFR